METRSDIINYFIEKRKYFSYLEIGVFNKDNFNNISGETLLYKISVDPDKNTKPTFVMKSDDFFKKFAHRFKFDIIFIDGMHLCEYVYRDINNSINCLNKNGVIICHDCLPSNEASQTRDLQWYQDKTKNWNGDSWKAFAKYLSESPYLCYTLDMDYGLGVVDTSKNSGFCQMFNESKAMEDMTWEDYTKYRNIWLNVKPKDYILQAI